jgi:hypothetical protein
MWAEIAMTALSIASGGIAAGVVGAAAKHLVGKKVADLASAGIKSMARDMIEDGAKDAFKESYKMISRAAVAKVGGAATPSSQPAPINGDASLSSDGKINFLAGQWQALENARVDAAAAAHRARAQLRSQFDRDPSSANAGMEALAQGIKSPEGNPLEIQANATAAQYATLVLRGQVERARWETDKDGINMRGEIDGGVEPSGGHVDFKSYKGGEVTLSLGFGNDGRPMVLAAWVKGLTPPVRARLQKLALAAANVPMRAIVGGEVVGQWAVSDLRISRNEKGDIEIFGDDDARDILRILGISYKGVRPRNRIGQSPNLPTNTPPVANLWPKDDLYQVDPTPGARYILEDLIGSHPLPVTLNNVDENE